MEVGGRPRASTWLVFDCDESGHARGALTDQRIPSAVSRIDEAARHFLADPPHYRPDIVDDLLAMEAFHTSYAAFAASKAPEPARGPQLESIAVTDAALAPHIASLNVVVGELSAHCHDENVEPVQLEVHTPEPERTSNLLWFVHDSGVPAAIAEAMLARLQSEAAHVIRCHAPVTWTTEDMIAIIQHREHALRGYARFLAGLRGPPITIIPPGERMDVADVMRQHAAGRANLDAQRSRIQQGIRGAAPVRSPPH